MLGRAVPALDRCRGKSAELKAVGRGCGIAGEEVQVYNTCTLQSSYHASVTWQYVGVVILYGGMRFNLDQDRGDTISLR